MRKLASLATQTASPAIILAVGNKLAMDMFGGKTLLHVGSQYDLNDTDIKMSYSDNKGNEIPNLSVVVKGEKYLIPLSRKFPMDRLHDTQYLLKCEFRASFVSVKEDDGVTPKLDAEGNIILNESKPYITFGRPTGITITREEELFAEVDAEKLAGS